MPSVPPAGLQTLRLELLVDPDTFDPCYSAVTYSAQIIRNLFSGLVQVTPEMDILPDSAHSWEISSGGRQYTFHLQPDLHWSDGQPVTSGDIRFTFFYIRDLLPSAG